MPVVEDAYRGLVAAYSLGALDEPQCSERRAHLAVCPDCEREVATYQSALSQLPRGLPVASPDPHSREELLDLCEAPPLPWDPEAPDWTEVAPGVRVKVHREDPER